MAEKCGVVYSTTNYSIFKELPGNRPDYILRGEKLLKSIKNFGQLEPIIVNEKMEVIDGQARLYALKKLGLPVEYVIKPGRGHDDCIEVNTSQKAWKLNDYGQSYAALGLTSYQYLMNLKQQFPDYSYSVLIAVTRRRNQSGGNVQLFKQGRIEITEADYNRAVSSLSKVSQIKNKLPQGGGSIGIYTCLLCNLLSLPEIDANRLIEQIDAFHYLLSIVATTDDAMRCLNEVYNHYKKKGRENIYVVYLNHPEIFEVKKSHHKRR